MFIIIDRFTRFEEITCIKRVTLGTLNEQRPRREMDIIHVYNILLLREFAVTSFKSNNIFACRNIIVILNVDRRRGAAARSSGGTKTLGAHLFIFSIPRLLGYKNIKTRTGDGKKFLKIFLSRFVQATEFRTSQEFYDDTILTIS